MKRFYKSVGVQRAGSNFAVTLDGRTVKTPGGEVMVVHSPGLADAIAGEWAQQETEIDLDKMHLTRLATAAVDSARADIAARLIKLARSDLLFYRAAEPKELVERQERAWEMPLIWMRVRYGATFKTGMGIGFIEQPPDAIAAIEQALSQWDMYGLVARNAAAGILGSVVLAFAMADGKLDAASAFAAAHIDETFQAEKWGEDREARKRLDLLLRELEGAETFLRLL
jgi:chaperone required for assembly of F1-ATPase